MSYRAPIRKRDDTRRQRGSQSRRTQLRPGLYAVVNEDGAYECWYLDPERCVRLTGWDLDRETRETAPGRRGSHSSWRKHCQRTPLKRSRSSRSSSIWSSPTKVLAADTRFRQELRTIEQDSEAARAQFCAEHDRHHDEFMAEMQRRQEEQYEDKRRYHSKRHEGSFETCPICEAIYDPDFDEGWDGISGSDEEKYAWLTLGRSKDEAKRWQALGDNRRYLPSGFLNSRHTGP